MKEDEIRKRRMCSFIAREIQKFWGNVKKVIELREQSKIEDLKKKALDQQLSFIVDQTEKYSDLLAEKFKSKDPTPPPVADPVNDDEFTPPSEPESDDENTIDKEEAIQRKEGENHEQEIDELNADAELSLEELKAKYGYGAPLDGK